MVAHPKNRIDLKILIIIHQYNASIPNKYTVFSTPQINQYRVNFLLLEQVVSTVNPFRRNKVFSTTARVPFRSGTYHVSRAITFQSSRNNYRGEETGRIKLSLHCQTILISKRVKISVSENDESDA